MTAGAPPGAPPRRVLTARVVPPVVWSRAAALIERNLMVSRHTWLVFASGFLEPIFYLLSIGIGIGHLIGNFGAAGGHVVSYASYAAPGLMASSAMNGAVYESTFNIYFKMKYAKTYDAVLATPVAIGDLVTGEVIWALLRGAAYAVVFLVVMLAMGLVHSWLAVLAVPVAVLTGFGFAAVGIASTSFMRSWQDFDLVQAVILPLFLFSATFYPLTTYPKGLRIVVQLTPLYHGVELLRATTLGTFGPGNLINVVYLTAMGVAGLWVAKRRLGRLLQP